MLIRRITSPIKQLNTRQLSSFNRHDFNNLVNQYYKILNASTIQNRLAVARVLLTKDGMPEHIKVGLIVETIKLLDESDTVFLLSEAIAAKPTLKMASYCLIMDQALQDNEDDNPTFSADARLTLAKLMSVHVTNVADLRALLSQINPNDRFEFSLSLKHLFNDLSDALFIFDSLFHAKKYVAGKHLDLIPTPIIPEGTGEEDDAPLRFVFMKSILSNISPDHLFMVLSRLAPAQRIEFKELYLKDKPPEERAAILFELMKLENHALARAIQFSSSHFFNKTHVNKLNERLDEAAEKTINAMKLK